MRFPRLCAGAASLALAATPLVSSTVPVQAASNETVKVTLFYDGDYVDTSEEGGGEAFNVRTMLEGFGITPTLVTDITADAFTTGLSGDPDVLIIPELEESEDLGADMSPEARAVVKDWVDAGGRLEVFGSSDPWPTVNAIFSTTITSGEGVELCADTNNSDSLAVPSATAPPVPTPGACTLAADGQATEFADGPVEVTYSDDTSDYADPSTFPAGTKTIYLDPGQNRPGVAVVPQGAGSIVFFAYDWYGTQLDDLSDDFDPRWFDILQQSLSVKASIDDVTVAEGADAVFTITLDEAPSQSVVIQYTTTDGSAVAGTDYTATTGSVTFAPGQTIATVTVPTLVRAGAQGDRTFTVELEAPYWGLVADGQGVGTITDAAPPTTAPVQAITVTPSFTG